MASWTVTVLPENTRDRFYDLGVADYVLPDGSRLPVVSEPVWCRQCQRVTNGEQIETFATLDRLTADLRDRPPYREPAGPAEMVAELAGMVDEWGKDFRLYSRIIYPADLDRRRWWRERRESPPRCLACGSTLIVPFPPSGLTMPHPRGHGELRVHWPRYDEPSSAGGAFTPEGERPPDPTPRPITWWQRWLGRLG